MLEVLARPTIEKTKKLRHSRYRKSHSDYQNQLKHPFHLCTI